MKISELLDFIETKSRWASPNCSRRSYYFHNDTLVLGNSYKLAEGSYDGDYIILKKDKSGSRYKLLSVKIEEVDLDTLYKQEWVFNRLLYQIYSFVDDIGIKNGSWEFIGEGYEQQKICRIPQE